MAVRLKNRVRNLRGEWGEGSPALFWKQKNNALILQKSGLFERIYVLNSHLKYSCKSIFDKKYLLYFLQGLSIVTWNFYQTVPTPRNLSCPGKFLVACLLIQKPQLLLLHLELWLIWLYLWNSFPQI